MSSSKDRERDRAPEPVNKSAAQDVLDEWMNWRERMRAIDQQYQEQAIRTQHRERHEAQRNAERDAKPDHIPTEDEMALHAPSTFHDASDEGRDRVFMVDRKNKTAVDDIGEVTAKYRPGTDHWGTTVGEKPRGRKQRIPAITNFKSGKTYQLHAAPGRSVAGPRIHTDHYIDD